MIAFAMIGLLVWAPWERADERDGLLMLAVRTVGMIACIAITVSESIQVYAT